MTALASKDALRRVRGTQQLFPFFLRRLGGVPQRVHLGQRAMSREGVMPASPTRPLGIRSSDSHKRYYGTFTYSRAFAAILPASSPCRSSQGLRAEPDLHPVIGRLDVPRKLAAQGLVVEVGMQVGQDGALGPDALDPGQRIVDGEMARMRRIAQRVEDPDFEVAQHRHAVRRNPVEVARIRQVPEPEAERMDVAVGLL